MTRVIFRPSALSEGEDAALIVLPPAPSSARSVSARIAHGLALGDMLLQRRWPAEPFSEIELHQAGLDMLVAISAALPTLPVRGARVNVAFSGEGGADAETPFGREVLAKFTAQLEACGARSVSC